MRFLDFAKSSSFEKKFAFVRDCLLVVGVFFAAVSMFYAGIQASAARTQLAIQSQQLQDENKTAENRRRVESARFVMEISRDLDNPRFDPILTAIEGSDKPHPSSFPIMKASSGKFDPGDVDDYLGKLDSIADLWRDSLIDDRMAYDEFSYDVEKTWCNDDVRNYVLAERRADGHTKGDLAFHGNLEILAGHFMAVDARAGCASLDGE